MHDQTGKVCFSLAESEKAVRQDLQYQFVWKGTDWDYKEFLFIEAYLMNIYILKMSIVPFK